MEEVKGYRCSVITAAPGLFALMEYSKEQFDIVPVVGFVVTHKIADNGDCDWDCVPIADKFNEGSADNDSQKYIRLVGSREACEHLKENWGKLL